MSVASGTASSHIDLLSKLRTFITSTASVADRWTELRYVTTSGAEELILRSTNVGVQAYVGIKAYTSSLSSNYAFILNGYTGYSGDPFYELGGAMQASENLIALPLTNSTIDYWFIANNRCIKIIAKIGSIYHQAYLGLMLPYFLPSHWTYPLCIGGSGLANIEGVPVLNNVTGTSVHAFWKPTNAGLTSSYNQVGTLAVRDFRNQWIRPYNDKAFTNNSLASGTWPYCQSIRQTNFSSMTNLRNNLDNSSYTLLPIIVCDAGTVSLLGELDGIKYTTGYGNSSGDTIVVGGTSHLCVPNVYRTGDGDYCAYKLA